MEQRNIIEWSEHSEYTELTIPSGEIWMSESELVDLFGVFIPKLRNTIQILYKEELVRPYETERTIRQECNLHLTVYKRRWSCYLLSVLTPIRQGQSAGN